jgi:hypothetical protein
LLTTPSVLRVRLLAPQNANGAQYAPLGDVPHRFLHQVNVRLQLVSRERELPRAIGRDAVGA